MKTVEINELQTPMRMDPYAESLREETIELSLNYIRMRQALNARLNPYQSEIPIPIDSSMRLFKTNNIGDTHLAHDHSDPDGLPIAVDEALKGDTILVLQGNIIESVSNKFLYNNTIKVALPLDDQVKLANAILQPALAERIVVALGKNTCHEGWSMKTSTHDVLPDIVNKDTPLIYSGGQIIFVDSQTGEELAVGEYYHNGGKGRTEQSPEGSMRARSREMPDEHERRPDVLIDAHMHRLTAAQDVHHNPVTREDVTVSLGEVGADKGTKDNPDEFLTSLGVPPRNMPADSGRGLVTIFRRKEGEKKFSTYPVAGYERADRLYSAMELWDTAKAHGDTLDGLKGIIYDSGKFPAPTVSMNNEASYIRPKEQASKSEGKAPIYKAIELNIPTELPISVSFIANTRIGSNSFRRDDLRGMLQDFDENPWAFYVATRRLVNQGVPLRSDRLDILNDLAATLGTSRSSLLAVMLTDELVNHSWGKKMKTKDQEDGDSIKKPLYPGDYLYFDSEIKGVPLIFNENVMKVNTDPTDFTLYLRDHLSHFASLINPYHGLTRVSQIWGIEADVLVGGHTEVVGWRTWMRPWGQLEIVVPGGFGEFIEKGLKNRIDYPLGGQGVVLLPGPKKALYSYASHRDGRDMHEALWVQEGLRKMGVLDDLRNKIVTNK